MLLPLSKCFKFVEEENKFAAVLEQAVEEIISLAARFGMKFSTTASVVCRSPGEERCNMRYKASSSCKIQQSICLVLRCC